MSVPAEHLPNQFKAAATAEKAERALDEKPFRLAKSFSLIAVVMIFAAVMTLAAVVSRQAEIIITKRVEDDTLKLMANLNHQMYENFLKKFQETGRSRLRESGQRKELETVIANTIFGFDLKRVLLFDSSEGRVVYDSDKALAGNQEDVELLEPYTQADGETLKAYRAALALYEPPRADHQIPTPWYASLRLEIFPKWTGDAGLSLNPTVDVVTQNKLPLNPAERSEELGHSWPWEEPEGGSGRDEEETPPLENRRNRRTTNDDLYLESLRSKTVFTYEGGGYLFLNLLPRGNFVLRSFKVTDNPDISFNDIYECFSELAKSKDSGYTIFGVNEEYCRNLGVTGVLEVDRDLTPEYRQIARLQYFALSMAFVLALGLTVVLFWVVNRGEAIITKRNLERQALREQLDQAERLAGLGSMVATVAHEIRNPLGIIHSTADVLNRFLASEPERARLAKAIVEEANRLSEVVTEFLDFARPPTPRLEPTMVEEVLEEILAFLEVTLTRAGVEVRCDFRRDQSPIPGDASMLHRAFLNILVNAIQAMDDGGLICVSTALKDDEQGRRLLVSISDTGPGLSEEAAKKMFSPFYTTKAKGTGLGLVIVRNIIEGHGGEITLKNGPQPDPADDCGPGLVVTISLKA